MRRPDRIWQRRWGWVRGARSRAAGRLAPLTPGLLVLMDTQKFATPPQGGVFDSGGAGECGVPCRVVCPVQLARPQAFSTECASQESHEAPMVRDRWRVEVPGEKGD